MLLSNKKCELNKYIRFSFGHTEENIQMGLEHITQLIKSYS
jgi:hypothetical protein